jgi:hypothetical protein
LPKLLVTPLDRVKPHEEVDPLRVERLATRISEEGIQINPIVCVEVSDHGFVILDGATRTAALRKMGLRSAVIQIVEPNTIVLETWHHVVRDADSESVLGAIASREGLSLTEDGDAPRVWTPGGKSWSVSGDVRSPNASTASMVKAYNGRWEVNRVIEADPAEVGWRFPDWALMVEFPRLSLEDVKTAALGRDLLPAGVTRFLVPNRALRLDFDLSALQTGRSIEDMQHQLDSLVSERAEQGRIRRYEEPVVVLDD